MRNICLPILLLVVHGCVPNSTNSTNTPKPVVFQANEGDRWLLFGNKALIFKIDPITTGSNSLIVGTEVMPPGNRIPTHKHLQEDEAIFVHEGEVRVTLAGRQYEARTGATVFIPHGTWVAVENQSTEAAMIVFVFNKPAFEHCLRAMSSRIGQRFVMPNSATLTNIRARCDEVMKE